MPSDKQPGGWKILQIVETYPQTDVFLEVKIALLNATKPPKSFDMRRFGQAVERSVKLCFEVSFIEAPLFPLPFLRRYKTHVSVVWRVVTSETGRNQEHLIKIMNAGDLPGVYGKGAINGSIVKINADHVAKILSGYDRNTIPHELGHTLGLLHVDVNTHRYAFFGFTSDQYLSPESQFADSNNVMFSGRSRFMKDSLSVQLSPQQIRRVVKNLQQRTVNH